MFVLKAWEDAKRTNRPIKIFYFSFEIGKVEKLFRWCSYYIFVKTGLRLPSDYIQGRINGNVPGKEHAEIILQAYSTVKIMMQDVKIVEDVLHPTKIFEAMIEEHFVKHGTVERTKVPAEELKKHPNKKGFVKGYIENDPDLITIMLIDHLALTGSEMGLDTKGTMDKMSKYAIVLRNLFYCTSVIIQQFSTEMMAAYRGAYGKKVTESAIEPVRLDFGDSKATYRDADVVIGGVKPDMDTFHGYPLQFPEDGGLGNYFVAWYLIKNRYGPANHMSPLFLDPIAGVPYDLPKDSTNKFLMQEWVDKAIALDEVCQVYSPKSTI